jgi:hypothetical protein
VISNDPGHENVSFSDQSRQTIVLTLAPFELDHYVSAFDVPGPAKAASRRADPLLRKLITGIALLAAGSERPRHGRAPCRCNEVA